MRRKITGSQKGFTLVEIIVVLVILAILAAIAIPTMLGFATNARRQSDIAKARLAYTAMQLVVTEKAAQLGDSAFDPVDGTFLPLTGRLAMWDAIRPFMDTTDAVGRVNMEVAPKGQNEFTPGTVLGIIYTGESCSILIVPQTYVSRESGGKTYQAGVYYSKTRKDYPGMPNQDVPGGDWAAA